MENVATLQATEVAGGRPVILSSPILKGSTTSLPPLIKIDPYTVLVHKATLQNTNSNHTTELRSPVAESNSTQDASKMPSTPDEVTSHPHYRPTVINLPAVTTPMDSSPQPLVPTPDTDRPERMRDWLVRMINSGQFPGLKWLDEDKMIFRVPWIHAKKRDYNMERDAALFREWAIHSGKYGDGSDVTTWKINFRCALNGLKDIIERRELEEPDCRVYQMLPSTGIGRRRKRRRPCYPDMIPYQPPERNTHPRIEFTSPATTPTATVITPSNASAPVTPIQVLPIVTAGGQIRIPIPISSFASVRPPTVPQTQPPPQQKLQPPAVVGVVQKNVIRPAAILPVSIKPPELRTDSPRSRDSGSQPHTPRTPASPAQFSPRTASPPVHAVSPPLLPNNIPPRAIAIPSATIPMFPALRTGPVYCPPPHYCNNPHAVSIRIMYGSITVRQETFDLKSGGRIYYGPLHCRDVLSKEEEEKLFGPLEAHQISLTPRHPAPLAKKIFGYMKRGLVLEANDEGILAMPLCRSVVYYGFSPLKHSGTLHKEERTRVFSYSSGFLSALKSSSEGQGLPPKPYVIFSLGQPWGAERPLSKNLVTIVVTYCKALNDLRVRNVPIHDDLLFEAQEGKDIRIISPTSGDLEAEEFLNPRGELEGRTHSN